MITLDVGSYERKRAAIVLLTKTISFISSGNGEFTNPLLYFLTFNTFSLFVLTTV